ncbi:MAG: hypothetical protein PHO72_02405 [Sphaerochaeta sp.]|nr:hypothetical protein [Sphaerochaeta sp.]
MSGMELAENVRITEEDRVEKLTPVEYLTVTGEVPAPDQVRDMKLDDLSRDAATLLLDAGCSKCQLLKLYGIRTPGGPHYKLLYHVLDGDGKAAAGTGGTVDERAETVDERAETVDEDEQKCRVCGCTDDMACPGGCYWVEPDLCSRCAEKMRREDASEPISFQQLRQHLKLLDKVYGKNPNLDPEDVNEVISTFLDVVGGDTDD